VAVAGQRDQRRKRHHYLPDAYLQAWADSRGQVAVRRRDQDRAFQTSTINVAVEADLYSLPTDDGLDDQLEQNLAEVEGPLPELLRDLHHRTPKRGSSDRLHLSSLLALQMVRTPEHLDQWLFPMRASEFAGEQPIPRDTMRRFLTEDYLGEPPSDGELQGALDFANFTIAQGLPSKAEIFQIFFEVAEREITPRIAAMAWALERPQTGCFLTSDRPLATWRRDVRSLARMGAGVESADELRFAVSPQLALVLRPRYPEHRTVVGPERVAAVNRHLASQCYTMVIGRVEDLSALERLQLRKVRPAMRFNTGPLFETGPDGESVPTGNEVLHMYVSYGDEALPVPAHPPAGGGSGQNHAD
jgi:hypothetical protein